MPRKGPAPRRPLVDDPVYGSKVVTQLVNRVLLDGKKTVAERIVYGALETVRERTEQEPVSVLKRALENIRPALEVRSRRVGGATYQVPVEVRPARATTLGGALQRGGLHLCALRDTSLADELLNGRHWVSSFFPSAASPHVEGWP